MQRLAFYALSGILLAMAASASVHAAIYKWVDGDGNVVYSQTPPPEGDYQRIRAAVAPAGADAETSPDQPEQPSDYERERARSEELEQIATQSAEIRRRNCEAARQNLQTYQVYRRIRDDEGNITVLADDERQARIEEAQRQVADFCD